MLCGRWFCMVGECKLLDIRAICFHTYCSRDVSIAKEIQQVETQFQANALSVSIATLDGAANRHQVCKIWATNERLRAYIFTQGLMTSFLGQQTPPKLHYSDG